MTVRPLLRLQLFVLLGALLLFGTEPLAGKLLLPSCGGSFHVWATCLMFFQGALFLGYLYCHFLAGRLGRWHLLGVLLPLAFIPIGRGLPGLEPDPHAPVQSILWALALGIGVPFGVLSTSGVIAQRWLAESELPERENPYPLFAASNGGSLLALLGYPLLIEPFLGLEAQRWGWSAAYLLYVGLAFAAFPRRRTAPIPAATQPEAREAERPGLSQLLTWCLLSAAPSACLLAVTNVIAIDLGSMPLVWVVPLSLYLLTFILTFGPRERFPRLVRRFWPEACAAGLLFWLVDAQHLTWLSALVNLGVLFLVCWVGHGELYRTRPAPAHLTGFYVTVSLGGWLGGIFVSLVAPRAFTTLAEYPLSVAVLAGTLLLSRRREFFDWLRRARISFVLSGILLGLMGAQALETLLFRGARDVERSRNVYGIYRVTDVKQPVPQLGQALSIRQLTHGTTLHGKELLHEAGWGQPLGYFHAASPLGEVLRSRPRPLRAAIVGLGTGALAGHLQESDRLDFYELDPEVERLARAHFHYLERSLGQLRVLHGDARLRLREAPAGAYQLLIVDAFSSDSIPTHLLTREALELYLTKLAPGGLLAFHISNRYYDLDPVLLATAATLDPPLVGAFESRYEGLALGEDPSKAFVLARSPAELRPLLELGWSDASRAGLPAVRPWTDDYANVLAALWARREASRRSRRSR